MADRASGLVKFFRADNGYGFIVPDGGGPDVFVHLKDIRASGLKELVADQRVTFEIVPGRDDKPRAANVRIEP